VNVSDAVVQRRSIRAFLDTPVDRGVIERVLDRARFAPSGGNVQPWQAVVVAGDPLRQLLAKVAEARAVGHSESDHPSYPDPCPEPFMQRRRECASALYGTLGITRKDKARRDAQTERNWTGFDAPCLIFCHTPAWIGVSQWADLGIWLQTVMLLMTEEGLATCPQAAWAHGGGVVRAALGIPADHVLYCGLAVGYADPDSPVNALRTSRAPLADSARFVGL